MQILLSRTSGVPMYEQIVEQVRTAILSGRLRAGDPLPSLRQLARDLEVSLITTTRAYNDLAAQGLIAKDGPAWPAAIPHDLGCSAELFPVKIVNRIMGLAMANAPVPVPQRDQERIQWAIDRFCWMTWWKHKRRHVEEDRSLVLQASIELWRKYEPMFAGYARIEEISPAFGGA